MGIHFGISQMIAYLGMYLLVWRTGADISAYYQQAMLLTGLTGLLAMLPCLYFYKKDHDRRIAGGLVPQRGSRLTLWEWPMFLIVGAFLGQYGNLFVSLFQKYLNPESYQQTQSAVMAGKSLWSMIFWMGIVAPLAEEVIFRWLVYLRMRDNMKVAAAAILSGLLFGIYHMNLVQGVYASLMGTLFALLMEWRGNLFTSVLLHMGANIWSLVGTQCMQYMLEPQDGIWLTVLNVALILIGVAGIVKCKKDYDKRSGRRLI